MYKHGGALDAESGDAMFVHSTNQLMIFSKNQTKRTSDCVRTKAYRRKLMIVDKPLQPKIEKSERMYLYYGQLFSHFLN
ncbi:MAG TPA: hypothetical protein VN441_01270, partial [Syntrophomonas sp.]|nr:hypothetical protein [Syntrophomonas sp.]